MSTYMMLLYNKDTDFEGYSPEEMQSIIGKYKAWGDRLEAEGRLIDSNKLVDETGRVLTRPNGKTRILDGPFSETKEIIGGYFAVKADSYEEAVAIGETCPHLDYDGMIEIREVHDVH